MTAECPGTGTSEFLALLLSPDEQFSLDDAQNDVVGPEQSPDHSLFSGVGVVGERRFTWVFYPNPFVDFILFGNIHLLKKSWVLLDKQRKIPIPKISSFVNTTNESMNL